MTIHPESTSKSLEVADNASLEKQIRQIDAEIQSRARRTIDESNTSSLSRLKTEITELNKRKQLLLGLKSGAKHRSDELFVEFADFRYGNLSQQETQAVLDLGEFLGIPPNDLRQDFSAFVRLMRQASRKKVLLKAIDRKQQKELQVSGLKQELARASQELETTMKMYSSSERKCVDLKSRIRDSENENNTLRHKLNLETRQKEENSAQHQREITRLSEEHKNIRLEAIGFRRDKEDCEDEIIRLKKALAEKNEHIREQDEKEKVYQKREQEHLHEASRLKKELIEKTGSYQRKARLQLKNKIDLEARLSQFDSELAEVRQQNADLTGQHAKLQSAYQDLRQNNQALQGRMDTKCEKKQFYLEKIMAAFQAQRLRWESTKNPPMFGSADERYYGYLISVVWTEIQGGHLIQKSSQVLQKQIERILELPDWIERYASSEVQQAIEDCNSFQQERLAYAETVTASSADSFPDLYGNAVTFVEHRDKWQGEWEFCLIQRAEHPEIRNIQALFQSIGKSPGSLKINQFIKLKKQFPKYFFS